MNRDKKPNERGATPVDSPNGKTSPADGDDTGADTEPF